MYAEFSALAFFMIEKERVDVHGADLIRVYDALQIRCKQVLVMTIMCKTP